MMNRFRKPWGSKPTQGVVAEETPVTEDGKISHSTSNDLDATTPPNAAVDEAHLKQFDDLHKFDPNLPEEKRGAIENALHSHNVGAELALEHELEENSPYPEVVASVRNWDEEMPANTVRAWVLGMLFMTIGTGCNLLFSLRNPSIQITSIVAQLVAYPFGVLWAKFMPSHQFNTFGLKWSLNPGPFNMKEHALITVMANVSFAQGAAYSTYGLESLIGFYKVDYGWGFALLFTISTQMIGLGLAGVFRRFLVYPAAMIWPSVLPNCALFYTLHDHSKPDPATTNGWQISRYRFFSFVCLGSFVWYWFPGFIWQGLSVFAFVTWIRPNNVVINQLFGGFSGLSLLPITFDWTYITAYIYSPLLPPWHAIANTVGGMFIFFWVTTMGIHYSGVWYAKYLPMSDSSSYDNTGAVYNVSRIINDQYTLDVDKYRSYSPLFLSTTFGLTYGLSFATIIAVIVHTYLFHRKEIWYQFKAARTQEDDIHMKLMKKYKEAPDWWFGVIFVIMVAFSFGTVLGYPTHLTWWALIIALIISIVWMVPIGMIQATTNIQIGLNVFTEFIISYMLPGRPLAMMSFKTYGYISMSQGLTYAQDLKLGHYMKVPPRTLFWGQLVASLWSCIVQVAVLYWAFGNINDICDLKQSARFSCPNGRVFFNASIIWGLIGPQRIFSGDGTYKNLQYFWLVGAIFPVMVYFGAKRWPKSPIKYINAPLIFGGTGNLPPATPLTYLSWGFVGFIFNKFIRNRYRGWWSMYNYVTSAALDAGLAISTIIIFFALLLPQVNPPNWWGNNVVATTLDYQGGATQATAPGGKFGPATWE
ncbi:small oligopeptide transporter, OPT family [Microthyrium microscopicum]|uniref:Small oligopeptide transporter, OPT family n=1 Tax=Microthyrium microscopicum TaxID=703497 RepID=A0A6A6TZY5_9PEZI|nr:small oligopeptide transporter, OPT family [Microthyrium microscopicum]